VTSPARAERVALCELFDELGPDAPTLLGGWTTRDLAAHLVVRERRPDAAAGILVPAFGRHTERVRSREARRPWPELVGLVRDGPPVWNPTRLGPVDTLANSVELFVHHEDVRRARTGWQPRALAPDLESALSDAIRRMGGMLTRAARVGLVLAPNGGRPIHLRTGAPAVTIRGPIGECVLYVYGRKDVAQVTLDGPDDARATVAAARFGL
jgi:uncharacterized protein (TIGR03085 family)